jgi:hypothetical protein
MARPRRSVTKKPIKEEEDEESAWEQSEAEEEDEEEFQADEKESSDDDDDDLSDDEPSPPPKKKAAAAAKLPKAKVAKITPAPRKKKKRRSMQYDTDTSDEGHLMPTILRKTGKGGYMHTKLSRSRISKANRGNTPWNKGKERSAADKAKIAVAVRARNAAILKEKLKKFDMTEEAFRAKQKEIKYLRERVRRAKVAAKKKRQQLDEGALKLQVELEEKTAARDEIVNTKIGELRQEDIDAAHKVEEEKMRLEAGGAKHKEKDADGEEVKAPDPIVSLPKQRAGGKQQTGGNEKAKKKPSAAKSPPPSRFPAIAWTMDWTPHPFDKEPPACPNDGPAGLICCEICSNAYSQFMSRSVQDLEGRRMEAVSNTVEELLGFIEESRMQLMVTAQSARQKPPPNPPSSVVLATNRRFTSAAAAAKKCNEDLHQDDSGLMDWDMTSPMDMNNFGPTTARI